MIEYISREAAIEIAMQYCPDDDGSCSKALADLRELLDEIDSIPAADVRPVVLCRDCKHWEYDVIFADGWCRGKHQGNPNWFCADGENGEGS